jgi:YVTN family beta-propeller protein
MWADPKGKQLWVNNDIDNTITVIDMYSLKVKTTISIGQKPHDIILSADGNFAFVTIFSGNPKIPDSIFKYSTNDFFIKAKAAVGKDPHVSLTPAVYSLYVPCQGAGSVFVLQQDDLSLIKNIAVPNAHGAYMSPNGKTFYTSNIAGGGIDELWSISTSTNQVIGSPVNTNNPTPHNIVINADGSKLFLTHSGATSKAVIVYKISAANPQPVYVTTLTTDLNPFGIAYYKSKK